MDKLAAVRVKATFDSVASEISIDKDRIGYKGELSSEDIEFIMGELAGFYKAVRSLLPNDGTDYKALDDATRQKIEMLEATHCRSVL